MDVPHLELIDLHKRYGDVAALDGCTIGVPRGSMFGFLGPNGAGKTTAMRTVFGLVQPDRGSIRYLGRTIEPADRLRFGYMPEQRGLYAKMGVASQLIY
ncbi:MAG: ATP-binding cassette domain-containing protein, partial [Acidimicrobiia bacterium]|nr:ATP-binding cassette domain-containing protein [Acidimicrobiia bacterium]